MEEKIEIMNLLQSKQVLERKLQSLAYGAVEIRENNSNKYIYVHYREDGVALTKYVGEYSDELYNLVLNNSIKAKELKKQIREITKKLKQLNYIEEELSEKVEQNIDFAKRHLVDTIYIGGGTPTCLNLNQLEKLLELTNLFNKKITEFTMETNVDLSLDKIKLLKKYGVNRISIGVQTVNNKYLKFLNRNHTKEEVVKLINLLKQYNFNINVDLIYSIPNQTLEELNEDLDFILSLDINHISTYSLIIELNHISTYSLIIEPHTKLYIDNVSNIDEDLDYEMYKLINKKLNKYHHYEISNYALKNYESKHNLVYWNNINYYGFGLGASGYINNIRYDNTKSYNNYINGNYILEKHELDLNETISNEFILGLRKTDGIDVNMFYKKYNIEITSIDVVNQMLKENKLILTDKLKINPKYIYISNTILVNFIDLKI